MTVQMLMLTMTPGIENAEANGAMRDRMPAFQDVPGLLQKFYIQAPASTYRGALFFFDSEESLENFQASELALTGGEVYRPAERPSLEVFELLETLYPEGWLAERKR